VLVSAFEYKQIQSQHRSYYQSESQPQTRIAYRFHIATYFVYSNKKGRRLGLTAFYGMRKYMVYASRRQTSPLGKVLLAQILLPESAPTAPGGSKIDLPC